ncbi:MAG: DMT family transporter [Rhodoferax sp.]|nr:DMT family transporter [Rhodoferax sp.]
MSHARVLTLTCLAMTAFAGNSLLCRLALKNTGIDPASFTSIRILSGALALWLIVRIRGGTQSTSGNWLSAFALFCYAACFSFAYVGLPAATGALLLFGAVQVTMIGYGLWTGEHLSARQIAGLVLAFGGLVGLVLPGLSAPPLHEAALMLAAGVAWGIYSLRGKGTQDPIRVTAGNFLRSGVFAVGLSVAMLARTSLDSWGIGYAIASGALASGVGYAIWYTALRGLKATSAASVQLSVPVIAAVGAIVLLGESMTPRLLVASIVILGGIALVIFEKRRTR